MTDRSRSRRFGVRTLVLATTAALALTGCTGGPAPTPTASGNRPGVDGTPMPPAPTTPVPAPGGGGTGMTVAPSKAPETKQEAIGKTAEVANQVSVAISEVKAITATAQGPGEVTGPAVQVTIDVANATDKPLDLSTVQVNLEDSAGRPGSGMTAAPAKWFTGSVPAGGKAQGVYVFAVPEASRKPVRVEVSVQPTLPTVVFSGNV